MTELEPGEPLRVARLRAPFPRGAAATTVLAIVVAMLCAYVGILLVRSYRGEHEREQLACQIERLGGQPVGGVSCPPSPRPAPHASSRPSAPAAGPTVIVVMPPGSSMGPTPPRSSTSAARRPSSRSSSRSSPAARPSASSSARATPSPQPVARICLPAVPCFPPAPAPRRRSS